MPSLECIGFQDLGIRFGTGFGDDPEPTVLGFRGSFKASFKGSFKGSLYYHSRI